MIFKILNLKEYYFKTLRTDPPGNRLVFIVGQPMEIKCTAVGEPEPTVEWLQ